MRHETPGPARSSSTPLSTDDLAAVVSFAGLEGVGPATLQGLMESGEPARSWSLLVAGRGRAVPALRDTFARLADTEALEAMVGQARTIDPPAALAAHRQAGVQVLTIGDPRYPTRLEGDPAPPPLLFARGSLEVLDVPAVAVVGTRNATRLGCDTAAMLADALVARGIGVVSGLALGIDGAAHRATVESIGSGGATGRPVGVVAAGLDVSYPRRHGGLHREVAKLGVLLSEVPLGTPPARWRFPARNRIIAALSLAVVVVESRSAGGSMLTVAEALARDVPVLAVPGHPSQPTAAGPLDLIAEGATPLRDVEDVLVAIGLGGRAPLDEPAGPASATDLAPLDGQQRAVLGNLLARPRTLSQLVGTEAGSIEAVASALCTLEERGLVARSGTWFEATADGVLHLEVRQ